MPIILGLIIFAVAAGLAVWRLIWLLTQKIDG